MNFNTTGSVGTQISYLDINDDLTSATVFPVSKLVIKNKRDHDHNIKIQTEHTCYKSQVHL